MNSAEGWELNPGNRVKDNQSLNEIQFLLIYYWINSFKEIVKNPKWTFADIFSKIFHHQARFY